MSIADGLNRFRGAFRDELAGVRAGLSDQGGESGVERLGQLQSLDRTGGPTGLGDYLSGRLGGWGGAPSGLDRLGIAGQWSEQERLASDPFAGFKQRHAYAVDWEQQTAREKAAAAQVRARGATAAGDWSGPATADDNATLDAGKLDQWIVATRPNSPLRGMGGYILQQANAAGVSVPLLMGILLKESELGTTAGPGFNVAGLTDPSRDQGLGGQRAFQGYGSWQQALDGAIRNLAGPNYKGKSAQDQIGMWYVGKAGDLNATDLAGNGTVGQYLNGPVAQAYGGLGVPFNQRAGGTRRAGGGMTVSPDGAIFPVVGWSQPVSLHWGSAEGTGGTDVMAPAGSQIVAVRGGQVTYAAYDPTGGWAVMIQGDDGLQYYMAHMQSAPSVGVGQRITAGTPLGLVGNTGNASSGPAHLHIGIGPNIRQGTGPLGGTGEYADGRPFDAVSYLNSILQGGRARPAASAPTTRPATTGRPIRY